VELRGRVALVTGGGRRVGRAIAKGVAERGAVLAIHYNESAKGAEELQKEIHSAGGTAEVFQADLSNTEAAKALPAQVAKRFGRLDILINSAGIITDSAEWNYSSPEFTWDPVSSRVYFFRDQSPSDLHFEEIDQATGQIASAGETPYHGDYGWTPPIRVSPDGEQVLTGGGNFFSRSGLKPWMISVVPIGRRSG